MRIREAAQYLGTSVWQVRKLANAGRIRFVQLGSGRSAMLFRRESLDKFIKEEES
jgi:excisionase family DNA binding protein